MTHNPNWLRAMCKMMSSVNNTAQNESNCSLSDNLIPVWYTLLPVWKWNNIEFKHKFKKWENETAGISWWLVIKRKACWRTNVNTNTNTTTYLLCGRPIDSIDGGHCLILALLVPMQRETNVSCIFAPGRSSRFNATTEKKDGHVGVSEKKQCPEIATTIQCVPLFPYHMVCSRVGDYSFQAVLVKEHWKQQIQLFVAQMFQ